MARPTLDPQNYPFLRSSRLLLLRQLYRKYGWKALYKQFRFSESRPFSRALIRKHAPTGIGLEVGVGEWTVAPVERTVLSDRFSEHASNPSIARVYFSADAIDYPDQTFSFLLSEHVLEHLPDAIRVLQEWKRVLKPGGVLFLILPHPARTFDRHRNPTPLEHFREDFANAVNSSEDLHYGEWVEKVVSRGLAGHYFSLSREEMLRTNSLHRHVFVPEVTARLLEEVGFQVVEVIEPMPDRGDSFGIVARR